MATLNELEKDIRTLFATGYEMRFVEKYITQPNSNALFDYIEKYRLPITVNYHNLRSRFNIGGRSYDMLNGDFLNHNNYIKFIDSVVNHYILENINYIDELTKDELDIHFLYNDIEEDQQIGSQYASTVIYINKLIIDHNLQDTRFSKPVNREYIDNTTSHNELDYGLDYVDNDFDPLS